MQAVQIISGAKQDIERVFSIDRDVMLSLNSAELLRKLSDEEFSNFFEAPYSCYLALVGQEYAGYGVLKCSASSSDKIDWLEKIDNETQARIERCAVLPKFRNRGIQNALIERRLLECRRRHCNTISVLVSPINFSSLVNLFNFGFVVNGIAFTPEGYSRLHLRLHLGVAYRFDRIAVECQLDDLDMIVSLCQEGMRGTSVMEKNGKKMLEFSAPSLRIL